MNKKKEIKNILLILFLIFLIPSFSFTESIDPVAKWAWGEEVGRVDFNHTLGDVRVFDGILSGKVWLENAEWVKLDPINGGVLNNNGDLSGSAWGENTGWVDFSDVAIDPNTGIFSGTAITENLGDISFSGDNIFVRTFWRGPSVRINGDNNKRFKGYAWSSNIGWISMNCSNTNSCRDIDYGVDVDSDGNVVGLAWSDHVGWLDFSYYNNAVLNSNTGKLQGEAQFLSAIAEEDDNWTGKISLSGLSPQYGPVLDFNSYKFDGFAWGSDVIGWIDFQTNYSVVTLDPFKFLFTANKGLSYEDRASYNGSVILKWTTKGADSCIASGGENTNWTATPGKPVGELVNATYTITNLKNDTLFTLTCMNSFGKKVKRDLNILVKPATPIVSIDSLNTNVAYNTPATLNWITENVSSCVASGDWSGRKAIGEQSETTGNLINPVNVFYLECFSDSPLDYSEPVIDNIQIDVEKLTLNFYPEQNPVPYGDKIKLYWDVEFANSCMASGNLPGFSGPVAFSDGKHEFEALAIEEKEGNNYSVSITCDGRLQTETQSIQFRVGKNPIYKEN